MKRRKYSWRDYTQKIARHVSGNKTENGVLVERNKAIFVPVPKVASSSIKRFLGDYLGIENSHNNRVHNLPLPTVPKAKLLDEPYKSDYFKFAFVRNPWERVASCFFQKIRKGWNINHPFYSLYVYRISPGKKADGDCGFCRLPVLHGGMEFSDFIHAIAKLPDRYADKHIRSQHTFLQNKQGELIVDHVGRFDRLGDEFSEICQRVGIPGGELPHLLRMDYGDYRQYYSPELWKVVADRYRRDIDLFGFEDLEHDGLNHVDESGAVAEEPAQS